MLKSATLILFSMTIFSSFELSAQTITSQGFENSVISELLDCDRHCFSIFDRDDDIEFPLRLEGGDNSRHSWISLSKSYRGQRSLGVLLEDVENCSSEVNEKNRVEFEISNQNMNPQHLEESRYYGMAIYIHPQSQPIKKPVTIMQSWQVHTTGSGNGRYPPFALSLIEGSEYNWAVKVSNGDQAPGQRTQIFTSQEGLEKGVWHRFIVWFKPSLEGKGAIRVWHNDQLQVSQTSNRSFGYPTQDTYPYIRNTFQVRFGAYRGRLCTTPVSTVGRVILFFDEIKYGTTYDSVDPG